MLNLSDEEPALITPINGSLAAAVMPPPSGQKFPAQPRKFPQKTALGSDPLAIIPFTLVS
jgi:hypothetical protein